MSTLIRDGICRVIVRAEGIDVVAYVHQNVSHAAQSPFPGSPRGTAPRNRRRCLKSDDFRPRRQLMKSDRIVGVNFDQLLAVMRIDEDAPMHGDRYPGLGAGMGMSRRVRFHLDPYEAHR